MNIPLSPQRTRPGSPSKSGQISKAAFFRAKSPVQDGVQDRRINALRSGWGNLTVESHENNEGSNGHDARRPSSPSTDPSHRTDLGHSPNIPEVPDHSRHEQQPVERQPTYRSQSRTNGSEHDYPAESSSMARTGSENSHRYSHSRASSRLGQSGHQRTLSRNQPQQYPPPIPKSESSSTFNGGSEELLMTLLAGQAAVDCNQMPIARWEEVEDWKKELGLLTSRLKSQVAKHQREQKILTAAKTLAKLNGGNKRMSKQIFESVEVAEQKAADAEREMLVLRDREGSLRKTLMEHWAGVMAWEVRRLENVVKIAEDKAARAAQDAREMERLKAIARRTDQLETELDELGQQLDRRDKKLTEQEDEAKILKSELNNRDQRIYDLESAIATTKDELKQRRQHAALIETEVAQHRSRASEMEEMLKNAESQQTGKLQEMERDVKLAEEEKGRWVDERVRLRELAEEGKMQSNMWETAKIGASQALGVQQIGNVAEMVDAIKKLSGSIKTRDEELKILKDEMREVSLGFEDEVARIAKERDSVRSKLEEMSGRSMNDETVRLRQTEGLEAKLRAQTDKVLILESENSSLKRALSEAETVVVKRKSLAENNAPSPDQQVKIAALRAELDAQDGFMEEIWRMLPTATARLETGLVERDTQKLKSQVLSPSVEINFESLRALYQYPDSTANERYSGPSDIVKRVKTMIEDGQTLVERVIRAGKERDLLKSNAVRAQRLVEEGQTNLKTYQRQVDMLESRLRRDVGGQNSSELQGQLTAAKKSMDEASRAKKALEDEVAVHLDSVSRLTEANDILSQRALTLADEMEQEKKTMQVKLEREIDTLRKQLKASEDRVDDERAREQTQRINLLDELNSLQSEVTRLRAQLRTAH